MGIHYRDANYYRPTFDDSPKVHQSRTRHAQFRLSFSAVDNFILTLIAF